MLTDVSSTYHQSKVGYLAVEVCEDQVEENGNRE